MIPTRLTAMSTVRSLCLFLTHTHTHARAQVRCTCNVPGSGEEREIMRLGKSEFFGERALLKNEPRAANVIGVGYVDCLVLERNDFINLLGPLQPILEREAEKRGQVMIATGWLLCVGWVVDA